VLLEYSELLIASVEKGDRYRSVAKLCSIAAGVLAAIDQTDISNVLTYASAALGTNCGKDGHEVESLHWFRLEDVGNGGCWREDRVRRDLQALLCSIPFAHWSVPQPSRDLRCCGPLCHGPTYSVRLVLQIVILCCGG